VQFLPQTINKVLCLDADILVTTSLKDLWETDITDVPAAAVLDVNCSNIHFFNRLGYDISHGYYNAGVLLVNLALWRNGKLGEECVDFVLKNPDKCLYNDQDAINYCLRGKIKTLPFRYNCLVWYFIKDINNFLIAAAFHGGIREAVKAPAIIHFFCSPKPWHTNFPLALKPFQSIWLYCKSQTPWKKERLKRYAAPPSPGFGAALKRAARQILVVFRVLKPNDFNMPPSPALVDQCAALLSRLKAL
jgi:lipopolysaccharide biosynthesis glycosyltransferase